MHSPKRYQQAMASSAGVLLVAAGFSSSAFAQSEWDFETDGRGCPDATEDTGPVLYGVMPAGAWHLDGMSMTYLSDGTNWRMRHGGGFLAPSAAATVFTDAGHDEVIGPVPLPFTFTYPGGAGATNAIDINVNGRIYLEAGTNNYGGGYTASQILPNFLASTPSICPLGVDFNPVEGGSISIESRIVDNDEVAFITWDSVPEYPFNGENTVQCQLWRSGKMVISFGATNGADSERTALVGVSAGGGAVDPGPSPLTIPIELSLAGTPILGESFEIQVSGLPGTAASGILCFSINGPAAPAQTLWGTPSGCSFQIGNPVLRVPILLDPPFGSVILSATELAAVTGINSQLQAFVFDPAQGTPNPTIMSNRGLLRIGVPPKLTFVVDGSNSYEGSPESGGFFQLRSSAEARHADIVELRVSLANTPLHFDTQGNRGVEPQGFFSDGNSQQPGARNAYGGTDATTGLVYGTPGQPASCDGAGTTGWMGGASVAGSTRRFRTLTFHFTDFAAGEVFGFDCDTDGGDHWAGVHQLEVTVTFADSTRITGTVQTMNDDRAVGVLIP